jgi:Family of unknown function (DUF6256)
LRAAFSGLVAAYALFVGMVLLARRRRMPRPRDGGDKRLDLLKVIETIVGGYTVFLAIVVVFHVWLAGDGDAFVEALWGGAFLSSVAVGGAFVARAMSRRRAGV